MAEDHEIPMVVIEYEVTYDMKEDKIVEKATPNVAETVEIGNNPDLNLDTVLESSSPFNIKSPTPSPSSERKPSPIHNMGISLEPIMNSAKPATTFESPTIIQILENILKPSTLDELSRHLVGEFSFEKKTTGT